MVSLYTNSRLFAYSRRFLVINLKLITISLFLICAVRPNLSAQTCGSCASANCSGIKQYANKAAAQAGVAKVWNYYSPALTSATGTFTVYATVTTDASGQVAVMQEFQIRGPATGITAQAQAIAGTRTYKLFAISDVSCTSGSIPANIANDGCSTTFNPAWTNLQPNTSYKLALTTNLSGLGAYTYEGFNIRFYNGVRPVAGFAFNCGTASVLGTFTANNIAGQTGTLNVPITGATSGAATFNVTGTGFTGSATTNIATGQTSVSIPITYDGTGAAGTRTLTVTSSQGTGTCTPSVTVSTLMSSFAFNCGTASTTGTYTANGTAGQTGSLTLSLTGTTAGQATFSVSGGGFSGSLTSTLTAGQTSVTIPITYDGSGDAGSHLVTVTSPQGSGTCARNITVITPTGLFTFNCGTAAVVGSFVANGTTGQSGFVTVPMTSASAGTVTLTVAGAGFSGTLTTILTNNQTQVSIPITYNGSGSAGSIPLSITSSQGSGTCGVTATVAPVSTDGAITFNCPTTAPIVGSFKANGATQTGLLSVNFTTQTAGEVTVTVSGNGFTGSYSGSVVAGQTSLTLLVTYDGSGVSGNHAITVTSSVATGTCAMNIPVQALFDFACANYNTSSSFTANGTSQNGTLVIPLSNTVSGSATFSVSGNGFTGSLTTVLQDSQRFVAIPVVYDGTGSAGVHAVSVTSSQASGACSANVTVKDPALNGCDYLVGQSVSFSINSQSTYTGYSTQYILVDANGVIKYQTATLPFTGVAIGSYDGYAVNYSGTAPTLTVGTNLSAIGGTCANLSNALPIKMCAAYQFSCGAATYTGAFIANGTGGQTGTLTLTLLNALAIPATISVSSNGFTGSVTQTLSLGTNTLVIPITFDGTGTGGTKLLTITGTNALGTCATGVDVLPPPPASNFTFTCGSAVINGTFIADNTLQSGSVTIPLTGVVAGTTNFTVTGTGFSGGLTNVVLTAGQTSISIPVEYNGQGPAGSYTIVVNSPQATAACNTAVTVINPAATFTFNCASATSTGTFMANGTAGQTGTLVIPLTSATAGTATFTVTGTGFTGTLSTLLTANQTSVTIPITYNGTGLPRTQTLTVTAPEATGTCTPSISVICPTITAPTTTVTQPTCSITTGTITVTAPSSGVTYSFDNGTTYQASNIKSSLAAATTYQVVVKDNTSGCASTATPTAVNATLAVPSAPTTTVTQPTCSVTTGTITVTTPSSGVTYSFDNGTTYQASNIKSSLAAATTYQVVVKDNTSGCASTATPSVVNATLVVPSAPTTTVTQPTCSVTTGTITVTAPSSGVTYSFDNGTTYQASNIKSSLFAATTYQVVVKDNTSGCASTATPSVVNATLTVPSAPTTTVTQPTCSVTTGTIIVTAPSSGVTYSFDNGTTYQASNIKSSLAAATTYQVVVKDNTSGCASTATPTAVNATLAVPSAPTTTVTQPTCSVTTGTITVTTPSSGVTYSFDNGTTYQASNIKSSLAAATTYQVVVKDNTSGCVSTTTPTVVNATLAVPSAPTTTVTQPTCSITTGTITVTAPSSGVTYSFDNGTTYQASNIKSGLSAATTYQVVVKDNTSGCASTATPTVVNATLVVPSAPTTTVTQPTCSITTGTITVTAPSSGITYSFDNGTTYQASNIKSSLAAATTYQVVVKDNTSGCASTATPTVVNAILAVPSAPTTTVTQPTCSITTGTITVTAPSSGVTYSFDNGTTYQASNIKSSLAAATTYQVVVKDNTSGCESTATPSVINAQPASPVVTSTTVNDPTQASCPVGDDGSITINATGLNLEYSKDSGTTWQASNAFTGLSAGTYKTLVRNSASTCTVPTNPATITIAPLNCKPSVADSLVVTTTQDSAITTCTTITDSNIGDTFAATVICSPNHGSLTPSVTGNQLCVTYTPTTGYVGKDSSCIKVCDQGGLCDTIVFKFTVQQPCITLNLKVLLEGPFNTTTNLMNTTLNERGLLPGQTPVGGFAVPTPEGQPYNMTPWNYNGSETVSTYAADVVDWVLVSFRTSPVLGATVFRAAGLLHSNGLITFTNPCINLPNGSFYIVIEHRNHLGVMSPSAVMVLNNIVNFDFTAGQSYVLTNPPSFGQKVKGATWVMYAADGKKTTATMNFDINFSDSQLWKLESGIFDQYRFSDFNMDADVNFLDSQLWKLNNGRYSGVPH